MNKKILVLIPMALLALALLTGCINVNIGGGSRTVRGTGQMVTRSIDVSSFDAIDISGNFRVVYRQAPEAALTVRMQENLFTHLDTAVRDGILNVDSRRNFDTTSANRPTLYVYAPNLTEAVFGGAVSAAGWDMISGDSFSVVAAGAVNMDIAIEVRQLDINVSGAGNLTLDMTVAELNLDIAGAATANLSGAANVINIDGAGAFNISAGDLEIESGRVNASGAANVNLSTLENVTVSVTGLARVRAVVGGG